MFPWDLAGHHRRHKKKRHKKPYCAAPIAGGYQCPQRVSHWLVGAIRSDSRYCLEHACKKIVDGAMCPNVAAKNSYCYQHLKCQSLSNGTSCHQLVKSHDPSVYKFCPQFHNCTKDDCKSERIWNGDTSLQFCASHRCNHAGCRSEKSSGPFCTSHTCEHDNCSAFATGGGDPGAATRYCERHRVCKNGNCERLAHTRENGTTSKFCGAHYCKWGDCDDERDASLGGDNCKAHTCMLPLCPKAKAGADSLLCKDHECKTTGCRWQKGHGDWCPSHGCREGVCDQEARPDSYWCEKHQRCTEAGCTRVRKSDGDRVLDKCEDHLNPACSVPGCPRRSEGGKQYCGTHLCNVRDCNSQKVLGLSDHCDAHKCRVASCPNPRAGINSVPGMIIAALNRPSQFCTGHACSMDSCSAQATEGQSTCLPHSHCQFPGCQRFVDNTATPPTHCMEHSEGRAGQRVFLGHREGLYGRWAGPHAI